MGLELLRPLAVDDLVKSRSVIEDFLKDEAVKGHLPFNDWQEVDGTALAAFADGASNTPGYANVQASEVGGIRWNNAAAPDPISCSVPIPSDLDASKPARLHIIAAKVGATVGDAVTWLVELFNNVDAALYDADADFGGTSSAMTGDAATKTVQAETLDVAAANLSEGPGTLTLSIQPTDGTLGTDDVILLGVYLEYTKRSSKWSLIADAGATFDVGDGITGASLAVPATDNAEAYLFLTNESFLIAENKPVAVRGRFQYAEGNTDDANVLFGVMDAIAADALVDDGAGPKASYSGAVVFKVDGGTVWNCESSKSTTQVTTVTGKTAGGSSHVTFEMRIKPISSTEAEVTFWYDPEGGYNLRQLMDTSARPLPIKHTMTYTSTTEFTPVLGLKAGGANAETLVPDYVAVYQNR